MIAWHWRRRCPAAAPPLPHRRRRHHHHHQPKMEKVGQHVNTTVQ